MYDFCVQVREITAKTSLPLQCSWESLEPDTTSILSSSTLPEKQAADDAAEDKDQKEVKLNKDEAEKGGREQRDAPQTGIY